MPEEFEQQEVLVAPRYKAGAAVTRFDDDEEEEEAPHEPDDHGDHPEVTEDLEGELDTEGHDESVEDFLSQQEPLADDAEEPDIPEQEDIVALAPVASEASDDDDDEDDEDDHEYDHDADDDDDDKRAEASDHTQEPELSDSVLDMLLEKDDE